MIKQVKKKIRLHLFNHEYSNMNIPYINEDLFALLLCKTKYTNLLECVRSTVSVNGPRSDTTLVLYVIK